MTFSTMQKCEGKNRLKKKTDKKRKEPFKLFATGTIIDQKIVSYAYFKAV